MARNVGRFLQQAGLVACIAALASACSGAKTQFAGNVKARLESVKAAPTASAQEADNSNAEVRETSNVQSVVESQQRMVEKSFSASTLESGSSKFSIDERTIENSITMRRSESNNSVTFKQESRPLLSEQFEQGFRGSQLVERFQQQNLGLLDIVVVIDNSGSMSEEQANLSTKLAPLLSSVQESNWQIGVITTDVKDVTLRAVIKKGDVNANSVFASAVTAGTGGSGDERGIKQSVVGLSSPGFLRPSSSIAVLIVSDENNCSTGPTGCSTSADKDESYLLGYLTGTAGRALKTQARVYGIVWKPGTVCSSADNQGTVYANAVTATTGKMGSICDSDYTATLNSISADLSTILQSKWELQQVPDAGTLKVFVNDVLQSSGFSLSGKTLTFSSTPPYGAAIRVEYSSGVSGVVRNLFPLQKSLLPGSETVLVNGAVAAAGSYNILAGTPATLAFNATPADGANIRVTYKENALLPKEFSIGGDVKSGTVAVTVNGEAASATYNSDTGKVVLDSTPPEAASIVVTFVRCGDPVLRYAMNVGTGSPANLQARDAESAAAIDVSYDAGFVVFKVEDFAVGKAVKISFRDDSPRSLSFVLPVNPLPDSVSVTPETNTCAGAGAFTVDKNAVTLLCALPGETAVSIGYKFLTKLQTSFDMSEVGACDQAKWELFLNNEPLYFFKRAGCVITPTTDLSPGAVIKIRAVMQ